MHLPIEKILSGGDLRSIGKSNEVISVIHNQIDFDELFQCLFNQNRIVVMRAADVIEKLTIDNPHFLQKHKGEIFKLSNLAVDKELKWHIALLMPRLELDHKEFGLVWEKLTKWAKDKTNSRIVRVNSIQGLFEMLRQNSKLVNDFTLTLSHIENENIPSLNARIKKLKNACS